MFSYITSFNYYNLKIKRFIYAHFFPFYIGHLPCFKILRTNPTLTSKFVHENSATNIEWNALKTTLWRAWEILNCDQVDPCFWILESMTNFESRQTKSMDAGTQCSSLNCAHAFQCEGLQNNHTSLKLSNFFPTLHKKNLTLVVLYWIWNYNDVSLY